MDKIKYSNSIILLALFVLFSFQILAQKPRKIFNYLQENQLTLAFEEYNKISSDKEYDKDDKVLFSYANCLFQIDTSYQKYNPTQAIKEFNGTNISSEYRQSIYKFLGKYTLSPEVINQKIINELYKEAIKLNTVESYTNALNYYSQEHNDNVVKLLEIASYNRVKSNKVISQLKLFITKYPESIYKTEIQNLLERETLNNYQSINNIDSLNQFITQFNSSVYKPEAIDFRDSLVLSNLTENYDSLLAFTKKYPESKFKKEVESRLPDLLYKEVESSEYSIELCEKFINTFRDDNRVSVIDSITFFKAAQKDATIDYRNYIKLFNNGNYLSIANIKIENKILSLDKINKCFNLDSLIDYSFCDNIVDFEVEVIKRYKFLLLYNNFKIKINNPNIQDSQLRSFFVNKILGVDYIELLEGYETDYDNSIFNSNYSCNNLSIVKQKKEYIFLFNSLKNYNVIFDIEVNHTNECIEIRKVFHSTGGVNMNQFLCVFDKNQLKLIFDYNSKMEEKFTKIINDKFKFIPLIPFYTIYSENGNNYKLRFEYKNLNDYKIMSSSEVKVAGDIAFPFKLINKNIMFDFSKIKLNKY